MSCRHAVTITLSITYAALAAFCTAAFADMPKQVAKLVPENAAAQNSFGVPVALHGNTALVADISYQDPNTNQTGAVYVFRHDVGGAWNQEDIIVVGNPFDPEPTVLSVALANEYTAVIGDPRNSEVGVYRRGASGVWELEATLSGDERSSGKFGESVAAQCAFVFVGDPDALDPTDPPLSAGLVYVFKESGPGNWGLHQVIGSPSMFGNEGDFGRGIYVDDETLVVLNGFIDTTGTDFFSRPEIFVLGGGGTWTYSSSIDAPFEPDPPNSEDVFGRRFGDALGIDGDTIMVSAGRTEIVYVSGPPGPVQTLIQEWVYVFGRNAVGNWDLLQRIDKPESPEDAIRFGWSIGLEDDVALLGMPYANRTSAITPMGATLMYVRDETGTWIQDWRLEPDDTDCNGAFGISISKFDDLALIGAFGFYSDCGSAYVFDLGQILDVSVDIKPGSETNSVNLKSNGVLPVAVLSTSTFDATQIDWESVVFGPCGATEAHQRSHIEDVDDDGDMDLLLHFRTQESGISCNDTYATLTGLTFDGQPVSGMDVITTMKCP